MANTFTNLYDYLTESGIVMPDTSEVKTAVEQCMINIFGNDLNVTEETPVGRLIEAITLLIVDTINVNAQNANQYNINYATGQYLDALASLFLTSRNNGETDAHLRDRIKNSRFTRSGFNESITSAIYALGDAIEAVSVIDNGHPQSKVVNGVTVQGHSIFVCVKHNGENGIADKIAKAIYKTKSAGCGYTAIDGTGATLVSKTVTDEHTNATYNVYFYEPQTYDMSVSITAKKNIYTGTDLQQDIKDAVLSYYNEQSIGSLISPTAIAVYVSNKIPTINVTDVKVNNSSSSVQLTPLQISDIEEDDITVSVL